MIRHLFQKYLETASVAAHPPYEAVLARMEGQDNEQTADAMGTRNGGSKGETAASSGANVTHANPLSLRPDGQDKTNTDNRQKVRHGYSLYRISYFI